MAANVNAAVSPESLHPSLSVPLRLSVCLSASVIEIESCIYIEFGERFSGEQNLSTFCANSKDVSRQQPLAKWEIHVVEGVLESLLPLWEIMRPN